MTTHVYSTDTRSWGLKAVLFCPACTYESPIDDNWLEVTADEERALVCPACGTVVDRRAREPVSTAEAD